MPQALSSQEISDSASTSLEEGGDIRARVRDLTLRALQTRKLEAVEIREVVRAVSEGLSLGAEHRVGDVKQALGAAVAGLDDALLKTAQAIHLALQELISEGKDFTDHDLGRALEDLKITEQAFLDTVGEVAAAAGGKIKREFTEVVEHARRNGTATSASVKETLGQLGTRLSATLQEGKASGRHAALTMGSRLAAVASGILAGMAEALRERGEPPEKK